MASRRTPDTEARDALFASGGFDRIDVRPASQTAPVPSAARGVSSGTRSTVRLCLESLEERRVPAIYGEAPTWDSALVWTPPSGGYETVTTELEAHDTGKINDHATIKFGEGINAEVWTGGEQFGLVSKQGALLSIGDANGPAGTVDVPLANDHLIVKFPATLTGATAIRLKHLDPANLATGYVLIDGPSGRINVPIPADGIIPWNAAVGIDQIMVVNQHASGASHPLGLDGIDVRMYLATADTDLSSLQQQETTLEGQVADAEQALADAEAAAQPAAIDALPWSEGVNAANHVLGKLNVHPGKNLYAVRFSPDGEKFVTAAQDNAKIWNAETGALIRTLAGNGSLVIDAVWASDGQSVWTTGYDRHVRQYSVADGSVLWDSGDLGGLALSAAMSADGTRLMVDKHEQAPIVIHTGTKQIDSLGAGYDGADQVQAMGDGNMLLGTESTVSIINPVTRQRIWQSGSIGGTASAVGSTPDGQWIFSGTDGGVLKVWRRSNSQLAFTLPTQAGCINSITVSPEGNQLFVGSGSQVQAFDLRPLSGNQTPTAANTYSGIGTGPRTVAVSGRTAMFVSGDGTASRLVALDRSFFAGYQDPNAAVDAARATLDDLEEELAGVRAQLDIGTAGNASRSDIEDALDATAAANAVPAGNDVLRMDSIEAKRMHVAYNTANLRSLRFTLSSPNDASYIDFVRPDGSFITRPVIDHPGGTLNGQFGYTFESPNMPSGGYVIRMYSNIGRTDLVEEVGASYYNDALWMNSVEPQAAADTLGERFSFGLPELGGSAEIRAWKGVVDTLPTLRNLTDDRDGFAARSAVVTLDLAGAEHLTTGVSFLADCEQDNAQITVVFYRGEEEIGRQTVTAGQRVSFADAGGITAAVILNPGMGGTTTGAVLEISNLQIAGDDTGAQVDADSLTRNSNMALMLNAHPDWGQNAETLHRGGSPGFNAVGRFAGNAVGLTRDMTKFSVVNLNQLSGYAAHPSGVSFHVPGGDAQLDPEYWDIIGDSVVLYPGAPAQIVIYLNSGDPYHSPGEVDFAHYQTDSMDELPLPSEEMTIRTDILSIRGVNAAEGVGDPILAVPDTGRATTPASGNVLLNVWNSGRTGGTVRVITNEGTADARELSFVLGAQAGKSVALDFTTPENGVLSVAVVLPDGRRVVDGRTLKLQGDSDEKRVATLQPDGTWALEWKPSSYAGPAVVDNGRIDPAFVAWKQGRIARGDTSVADPANYQRAALQFAEERAAQRVLLSAIGSGGTTNVDAELQEALALYDHTQSVPGNLEELVDSHGMIGKVILGTAQRLWLEQDQGTRAAIAANAEAITGVDADYLLNIPRADITVFARRVQGAFTRSGFGFLFERATLAEEGGMRSSPDRLVSRGGVITVRWDLADAGRELHHVRLYIVDDATGQKYDFSGDLPPAFSYAVPADPIAKAGIATMRVKVVAWFKDANGAPTDEGRLWTTTGRLLVSEGPRAGALAELSTLPNSDLNRTTENAILNRIAMNMPVDVSKGWYNLLGSPHHHGIYSEHAVDFNFGNVGEDRDAAIRAVDDGQISRLYRNDDDVTILVITHTLPGGQTWDSVYMHMPMTQRTDGTWDMVDSQGNVVATLKEGDDVLARQIIGANGSEGADGEHLHFEAHRGTWRESAAINLDGLFRSLSPVITTRVLEGGPPNFQVTFDQGLQEWVNAADRIVADIVTVDGAAQIHMLAWEAGKTIEQMERVVRKTMSYMNASGVMDNAEIWVSNSDDDRRWDPGKRRFVDRLTGIDL